MRTWWVALQFLTCLPVYLKRTPSAREWGNSVLWYPAVGLLIGAVLLACSRVTTGLEVEVRAALVLIAWVVVTGALHLDGLADTADGWVGGHGDREQTLRIMRDPRIGPAGATAIVLVLLMKFAALTALLRREEEVHGLILAPMLARVSIMALVVSTPYARPSGLGEAIARNVPPRATVSIAIAACIGAIIVYGLTGLCSTAAMITVFGLRPLAMRRLGGWTGDLAGGMVETSEIAVLVTAVALNQ